MSSKIINNQDGFALIAAMMFLLVLTVIGIAATNTTSIEIDIAGNDKLYKQNFYMAEGAARQASHGRPDPDDSHVHSVGIEGPPPAMQTVADISVLCTQPAEGLGTNTTYGIIDQGIPTGIQGAGESLKAAGTGMGGRVHFLDLYGKSTENNTSVGIVLGYTTRL